MTRLTFASYLDHLRTESARFREVLTGCDPAARVPACPDWDAADLLWHLAEVQWFWARAIRTRPEPAREDAPGPDRPPSYEGLLAFFDACSADLQAQLSRADPAEQAWSWAPEQTVGFSYRRQAHEALIHRLDAEQTAGPDHVTPLDPDLAADGVAELVGVMYGGVPDWASFRPLPHHVRLDLTGTATGTTSLWVQLGLVSGTHPDTGTTYVDDDDVALVDDPGVEADTVVTATAAVLDAWLWQRGDDADGDGVAVSGDRGVYDRFRACVSDPLN